MSAATSLLLKIPEVADELRLSVRETYYLLGSHPELVVELPGVRGKRVSRERLADFVERLNPTAIAGNEPPNGSRR